MEGINWNEMSDSELAQIYDDSSFLWTKPSPQMIEVQNMLEKTLEYWVNNIENPHAEMLLPTVMMLFFYMDFILHEEEQVASSK
jgi:hypothetical protein